MRRGPRSKVFRLGRAKKVLGVPITKDTGRDLNRAMKDIMMRSHAPEEVQEARKGMCMTCEHRREARCDLCGCFIDYKAKLRNSECPVGKWSGLVPETLVDSTSDEHATEQDAH